MVLEPATGISGQDTAVELDRTGRNTGFLPAGTFGTAGLGLGVATGGALLSSLILCIFELEELGSFLVVEGAERPGAVVASIMLDDVLGLSIFDLEERCFCLTLRFSS